MMLTEIGLDLWDCLIDHGVTMANHSVIHNEGFRYRHSEAAPR